MIKQNLFVRIIFQVYLMVLQKEILENFFLLNLQILFIVKEEFRFQIPGIGQYFLNFIILL